MEKSVWILEDTEIYRERLESVVDECGFEPVSFVARNPFLRAYFKERDKGSIYGMILDNQVPYFDEAGCLPERNVGVEIVEELNRKNLLEGLKVVLYTSDERNSEIEWVCGMGVEYQQKFVDVGVDWVREFLNGRALV